MFRACILALFAWCCVAPAQVPLGDVADRAIRKDGKIQEVANPNGLHNELFSPAFMAVRQWQFRPYLRDGKPDSFFAEIRFAFLDLS